MSSKTKNNIDPNKIEKTEQINEFEGKIAVCRMENKIDDLVKFNTFHNLHKKTLKLLLSSFLVFIGGVLALTQNSLSLAVIFFVATPMFPIVLVLIQRVALKAQLQKDFEFAKTTHSYEFSEPEFYAVTKCGKRIASVKIEYKNLASVYNTPTSFYIYINQGNAFVLNKTNFVHADVDEFASFIKGKIGSKFKTTTGQKLKMSRRKKHGK